MLYGESEATRCHVSQRGRLAQWRDCTISHKAAESAPLPGKETVASLLSRQTQGFLPSFLPSLFCKSQFELHV